MISGQQKDFFGGLSCEVGSISFECLVSIAKESLFKRESTIVFEIVGNAKVPSLDYLARLKIIYDDSMSKSIRLQWRGRIVEYLDQLATQDEFIALPDAIISLNGYLSGQPGIQNVIFANLQLPDAI